MSLAEAVRRRATNHLARYLPYPKQFDFHAAGADNKERLLMAGNRLGKTFSAGFEMAMHMTGRYPDWWPGRRFDKPIVAWTGAETNELSRKVTQKVLLGTESSSRKDPAMGTGTIPGDAIREILTRQAGIRDVVDTIRTRHVSGGNSVVHLKTYEQGRKTWQGAAVDVVWPDEEADEAIYSEAVTRTMDTGGIVMMTFTPLLGMSEVVKRFLQPSDAGVARHVTTMTIDDCVGGVWDYGPWKGQAWTGHYTRKEADQIIATYPEHERETRAYGVPMMGEGRVYPINESVIACDAFEIPKHWPRLCALDFGVDHPFAAVWGAWNRDQDTIYIYDAYKQKHPLMSVHAASVKSRDPGGLIPIAWPHDGLKRQPKSGQPLYKMYRAEGLAMMNMSARYEDKVGGRQAVEPAVLDIMERMGEGRFKVFRHLGQWFEEFRVYHRKDGLIVDRNDDLMAATRYLDMMIRKARVSYVPRPRKRRYQRPIVGGALA